MNSIALEDTRLAGSKKTPATTIIITLLAIGMVAVGALSWIELGGRDKVVLQNNDQLERNRVEISALQTQVDAAKAGAVMLQKEVTDAKQSRAQLQNQLEKAAAGSVEVQKQLTESKASGVVLQGQIDAAIASADQITLQVAQTKLATDGVQRKFDESKAGAILLQTELSSVKTQSAELATKLEKAEGELAAMPKPKGKK